MEVEKSSGMSLTAKPWLTINGQQFYSRLLVGIEQYDSPVQIREILEATESQVFITTFDLESTRSSILLSDLACELPIQSYIWVGTTSFARSAKDALTTARLLQQSLGIQIIKLDVRTQENFPSNAETISVARELLAEGLAVLPFIWPDHHDALELERLGCSAIRLMAAPVGSGRGLANANIIAPIIPQLRIPVIIEGGLATATDVSQAMELGADAVLINTALVKARNPLLMARAMKWAVEAGYLAYLAGRMPVG